MNILQLDGQTVLYLYLVNILINKSKAHLVKHLFVFYKDIYSMYKRTRSHQNTTLPKFFFIQVSKAIILVILASSLVRQPKL